MDVNVNVNGCRPSTKPLNEWKTESGKWKVDVDVNVNGCRPTTKQLSN